MQQDKSPYNQMPDNRVKQPNRAQLPDPSDQEQETKKSGFSFSELNWPGILAFIMLVFVILIASIIIKDLSGIGSNLGAIIMGWWKGASIIPGRSGFEKFLSLLLTTGFIGGLLYMLLRK